VKIAGSVPTRDTERDPQEWRHQVQRPDVRRQGIAKKPIDNRGKDVMGNLKL
jgi:hypothetical protein